MKKIGKTLFLSISILMLSGCGVFDMISKQSKENHEDQMDWFKERDKKNKENLKKEE